MQPGASLPPRPSSGAERMARHRRRRKEGLRCLTVVLREAEIDTLIRRQRLPAESRSDLPTVKKALYGFLDDMLR
jgi:hypothetical protein